MITPMQQMADDIIRNRAGNMLKRIKLETHWALLTAPERTFQIDESGYAADRKALVITWPAIRRRRLARALMIPADVIIEDAAALFADLIEIRRQRTYNRRNNQ